MDHGFRRSRPKNSRRRCTTICAISGWMRSTSSTFAPARRRTGSHGPAEGSIEAPLTVLAELQRQGLVRHIGLSNVTPAQIAEGRTNLRDRLRAESLQSGASRRRCPDRRTGPRRHRLCAVFSAGRLHSAAIVDLVRGGCALGATPMQVALAWLLRRAPNILLIPGTSSVAHLRENVASVDINLPDDALASLNGIASTSP